MSVRLSVSPAGVSERLVADLSDGNLLIRTANGVYELEEDVDGDLVLRKHKDDYLSPGGDYDPATVWTSAPESPEGDESDVQHACLRCGRVHLTHPAVVAWRCQRCGHHTHLPRAAR